MASIVRKPRVIKAASKPAKKPVVTKPSRKAVVKEAAASPSAARTPRVAADRFSHEITSTYGGPSPVLASRKSRTALRTAEFGTATGLVMSERDMALLKPLKAKYRGARFQLGDADRGIVNRAIRKGLLRHVGGDATHDTAQLQFVG